MEGSAPTPDALLEHVGFLRALALSLLRNEADADDAVQQALATALEKPPPDPSHLRGWLAAVTRNVALMQYRTRTRRRAREERAARPEGGPSTADISARMEMEQHVVAAMAQLEEPFRTTLILRYYDGLQPKEIGERMDVPAATVRTRLKRGLDKLKGELERRSGGRKSMLAGLLLLAQMPARAANAPWLSNLAGAAAVVLGVLAVGYLTTAQRPDAPTERTA
ncbi:MAG: sigma-70 family RNA polymerase sigma factor, partial [Planctomycetota bacterium]